MTKFTNGPAAGVVLSIRRAPLFIRVVRDESQEGDEDGWDALDQLDDKPRVTERIYAYRKVKDDGVMHLSMTDKRGRRCGGMFHMATYEFVEPQPPEKTMRGQGWWRSWCKREAGKAITEKKGDAFVVGFAAAEGQFNENENRTDYQNPFQEGTEQFKGFEEAVYIFTQK